MRCLHAFKNCSGAHITTYTQVRAHKHERHVLMSVYAYVEYKYTQQSTWTYKKRKSGIKQHKIYPYFSLGPFSPPPFHPPFTLNPEVGPHFWIQNESDPPFKSPPFTLNPEVGLHFWIPKISDE